MTKRKYKVFIDIVTVLLVLFPLVMSLVTARANGTFDGADIGAYVENFAISRDLANTVGESINNFGIAFDGEFYAPALVIFSNAIIIYLFRLFLEVALFIPKLALKFINISMEGEK